MRDFFINSLEILVSVIVVLLALAVIVAAGAAAFGGGQMSGGMSGPLAGLGILIGGTLYVIIVGGFLYMGIGIYQNTKRSAEALERMATR
jgi:hypothetical protein